jgi:hypothetical protein
MPKPGGLRTVSGAISSFSARSADAILHMGQMEMNGGQAAPMPVILAKLVAKDDAAALLLTGKAQEQTEIRRAPWRVIDDSILCAGLDRSKRSRSRDCSF